MQKVYYSALIFLMLCACTQTPDVTYTYYPSTSKTTITVTQSIDCNTAKTTIYTIETPQIATAYMTDFTRPQTLKIKDLDGFFADSDIKFGQTEDGRLLSVDQSTTGQGLAIIKGAVAVVGAAAAVGAGAPRGALPVLPECNVIAKVGAGKPVTLTYTIIDDLSKYPNRSIIKLKRTPGNPGGPAVAVSDGGLYADLFNQLPDLNVTLHVNPITPPAAQVPDDEPHLTLQQTVDIQLDFQDQGVSFGSSSAVVPTTGTYRLPIPKAAIFGKQSLSLAIANSGAITSIEYGKTNGAADAANALSSVLTAPSGVATNIAADTKAQGDIIAQNSRLVRCKAKPETCT